MAQVMNGRLAQKVTSEEVRDQLGELINRVAYRSERMIVTRRGKDVMALVPMEDFEFMERVFDLLEDRRELPIIRERLAAYEKSGESISLEQFEAELLG